MLEFQWVRNVIFSKEISRIIHEKIINYKAVVMKVEPKISKKYPALDFLDLKSLMALSADKLLLSGKQLVKLVKKLYSSGIIS